MIGGLVKAPFREISSINLSKITIMHLVLLTLCAIIAGTFSLSANAATSDVYNLIIGSSQADFNNDRSIDVQSDHNADKVNVTIYVNGNPIDAYHPNGTDLRINQWLKPGKNTVSLKGQTDKTLYVKIAALNPLDYSLKHIIEKKAYGATDVNRGTSTSFYPIVDYNLPIFDKANALPSAIKISDFYPLFETIQSRFKTRQYNDLALLLYKNRRTWMLDAYGHDSSSFYSHVSSIIKKYEGSDTKYKLPNRREVKFIKGKNTILVYAPSNQPGFTMGFYSIKRADHLTPAFKLAFIDGKWSVWE